MAADVKAQASVLQKNISDYPRYSELDAATIASGKTLCAMGDAVSLREFQSATWDSA